MTLFRKRPVIIEAWRFAVGDDKYIIDPPFWLENALHDCVTRLVLGPLILIDTLEGQMAVQIGDWIIKGVKGELYPCKPDIFAATYDAVEAEVA